MVFAMMVEKCLPIFGHTSTVFALEIFVRAHVDGS